MLNHLFGYVLEIWRRTPSAVLGRMPIEPDWVPAREALILDLLRRGVIEQPAGLPPITVEPIWEERDGPPMIIGFRAALIANGIEASRIFSITYFRSHAQQLSHYFVQSGDLKEGEAFDYDVLALPKQPQASASPRFSLSQQEVPLSIKPASFKHLMNSALLFGTENSHDLPVFFHWRVLEEASILTRKAGSLETGGILMGHVCRDAGVPELFLEITALIPARAQGELTRLSFTPQTWTDVQAALNKRNRHEVWLGWFHSHSFYHQEKTESPEPTARQPATPFLSEDDHRLHRICFPRAYGIALLVTDSPQSGMSWTTFGWRSGQLVRRAYHVIHSPLLAEFHTHGENNETNRKTTHIQ